LEQFLAPIFTACFRHGHVPAAFQNAIAQPILKGADKDPALSLLITEELPWHPLLQVDGMVHNSDVWGASYQLLPSIWFQERSLYIHVHWLV